MGINGSTSHICKLHYDLYTLQVNMQRPQKLWNWDGGHAAMGGFWWVAYPSPTIASGVRFTLQKMFWKYRCKSAWFE